MDPVEALKWASLVTGFLGGGALGLKKLLTIWGKESAQSSGALAANDIIVALREEVENQRKNAKHFSSEHEASMLRISELHKEVAKWKNQANKLAINNRVLKKILEQHDLHEEANSQITFSDTDLSGL